MWALVRKEMVHLLGSSTGYLAICVYLVFSWLYLFIFPQTNILDSGYASLAAYLELAPWVFMLLIPALAMRLFPEEIRSGTIERLVTLPLRLVDVVLGKYLACLLISLLCITCTIPYLLAVSALSTDAGFDIGGTISGYLAFFLLATSFTAISVWTSLLMRQAVTAFLAASLCCFLAFFGFMLLSQIQAIEGSWDYYLAMWGIASHFDSIARGVLDVRDIVYFFSIAFFFLSASVYSLGRLLKQQ